MATKRPPNRIETLPSSIEVAFWDKVGLDGESQERRYLLGGIGGERVPSVSTVAGIFEIPALMPKAVKMQEEAVIALAQTGVNVASLTREELRAKLWDAGTHYDAIWKRARERGDIAHDMLLALIRDGQVPNLADYPDDLRPWLSAGLKFARDYRPKPIAAEYLVASIEHGFAGRSDLLCELQDGRVARVDYKTVSAWSYLPLRKDEEEPGRLRPPYDENLIALAGYELAAVESGYLASDVRLVVRLGPDGEYDVTESHATEFVFKAALTAYNEKKFLTKVRPAEVAA
ncbi:MAG TPA: hypothetical protein VMS11_03395 [Solirubrobacterales bacterium]|nr:hypothetical protein [Solirubrobacterales bacterium]